MSAHPIQVVPAPPGLTEPEVRVEGRLKTTGAAAYAADVSRPGMLWAAFLTSELPFARIRSVDTVAAGRVPGVHAVLTGRDIGLVRFGRCLQDRPVLAVDRVRFVGERIAAVAAETPEAAEAALALIEVGYEELPPILDPAAALRDGAPVLHPDAASYAFLRGTRRPVPHPNVQGHRVIARGEPDIERALAAAYRVFEHAFATPRQHHGYIEPHATLVWIDDEEVAHFISTNKAPFSLRRQLSVALGIPVERVVIDSGFIGGDFGGKGDSTDEHICYFLARATGRPVKAVTSSVDELRSGNTRHAATMRLRTGVDRDGTFLAHHAEMVFDGGAYAAAKPLPHLVLAGGSDTLSAYRVPNVRLEISTVYTNAPPGGHMRAPGEVQARFAGESHVDMIAAELGIDPIELRLRNAVRTGDAAADGKRFREARAVEVLEALRGAAAERPRVAGAGRGVALGVRHVGGGRTSVLLRVDRSGVVEIVSGVPDQGGGAHTVIQRVAAATLGVAPDRIRARRGSTREAPFDPGAGGSRVTHLASRATQDGAERLKALLEKLATERVGAPEPLVLGGDQFRGGGLVLGFDAVAELVAGDGIEVEGAYDAGAHAEGEPEDHDFAGCLVEVRVDPETGEPTVLDAVVAVDVGTIINPVAHRGQLAGGFVFGLGGALMEELRVDEGAVTSSTLAEVKLPTSVDVPPLRIVHLPTEVGPGAFGAKMAGEAVNAIVAPAVANAVADAVGARVTSLPITAERIWAALRGGDAAPGSRSDGPGRV